MTANRTAVNGLVLWLFGMAAGIFLCQSGYAYELQGRQWFAPYLVSYNPQDCPEDMLDDLVWFIDSLWFLNNLDIRFDGLSDSGDVRDGINTVFCSDDFRKQVEISQFEHTDDIVNGRFHSWFRGEVMVECDVRISPAGDLTRATLWHELTHCLGLSHVLNLDSLMNIFLTDPEMGLHIDDIAGLCFLYDCDAVVVDYLGNAYIPKALTFSRPGCFEGRLMISNGMYRARQVSEIRCSKE